MARKAKGRARAPRPVADLVRRQRAIDASMRRFGGHNFKLGKIDCLKMIRAHAVAMGHRGLPKVPDYSSPGGAMRALATALKRRGADPAGDLGDLLDAVGFTRIAPAMMLQGDVALLEAEPQAPAWRAGGLVVFLGHKYMGWHADSPVLAICEPLVDNPFVAAWRL